MNLPVPPPLLPMLAKRVDAICRRGRRTGSSSRSGTASARSSFATATSSSSRAATRSRSAATSPSSTARSRRSSRTRCVLDGEIVIAQASALDFEALQLRLHPAASRVKMLAARDARVDRLLGPPVRRRPRACAPSPFRERRARARVGPRRARRRRSTSRPRRRDRAVAADWFAPLRGRRARRRHGQARRRDRTSRTSASMLKVKHERECDCVVAGFRWHKGGEGTAVGSLLLGLYDDGGVAPARRRRRRASRWRSGASSSTTSRRTARDALAAHPWKEWAGRRPQRAAHADRRSDAWRESRWSQGKDLSWEPLRPELVVQVAYDHMQGIRFRHTAQFRRWRARQAAARLHLRAARGRRAAGARRDLQRRRFSGACLAARGAPLRGSGRRPGRASPAAGARSRARGAGSRGSRVQVDERPRIESTSTSSTARCPAASGWLAFQRSSPASAASLFGRVRDDDERHLRPRRPLRLLVAALSSWPVAARAHPARAEARRAALPRPSSGSAAATARRRAPRPRRARRARGASRAIPAVSSIPACGSPIAAKRAGIVSTVKSAGSHAGTSSQVSGADTRASGSGRTEYAEQVVRSLAFWL